MKRRVFDEIPSPMALQGYYQRPTISGDLLVFLYEDDLWLRDLSSKSTLASRLTSNPGRASDPQLSPDGRYLAYTSLDEGHPEIYVTDLSEMEPRRLTYLGEDTRCVGWSRDGESVLFTTSAGNPFSRIFQLASVPFQGGPPVPLNLGHAAHISYAAKKGRVLGRHTWDPARWKRYRGGTAGQIWVDISENGNFRRLEVADGNLTRPLWVKDRIYFGSDHEGICNLYSCQPDGSDLKRHSDHKDFYLRYPSTDGKRIVYQCGGDIYLMEPEKKKPRKLELKVHTQRQRLARRFVTCSHYLQDYALNPDGSRTTIVSRGKLFHFAHWEEAVKQLGEPDGVRYRLPCWGAHGIFHVNDRSGEEEVAVFLHSAEQPQHPERAIPLTEGRDIGRVLRIGLAPCGKRAWFTNHRHELFCLELTQSWLDWHTGKSKRKKGPAPAAPELIKVAEDRFQRIREAAFSPDSQWLAFARNCSRQDSQICLWNWQEQEVVPVTTAPFYDWSPDFDPEGRFLYFLSCRDFDPVKDNLFFEYSFPEACRPYLVTLQEDQPDPFLQRPRAPGADPPEWPSPYLEDDSEKESKKKKKKDSKPRLLRVNLEGIQDRVRVFPVSEARYFGVLAAKGKLIIGSTPTKATLGTFSKSKSNADAVIHTYDFKNLELTSSFTGVSGFDLSQDRSTLIYRADRSLRVVKAEKMTAGKGGGAGRSSGWLDLNRVMVSLKPRLEWQQMFREAWRLMRDHFWDPNMASVDWAQVLERYTPLLDRISTRREFSDLLWEFQGELGTSHAYEYGGDYASGPYYAQGKLASTLRWDGRYKGYRIIEIARGDPRSEEETSPLRVLHHPLLPGDVVLAVNGHRVSELEPCEKFLVNQAEQRVTLTVLRKTSHRAKGKPKPEEVEVFALKRETPVRYREWVEKNRDYVHAKSEGRLGYLHIPNMSAGGFAEFHRGYYSEMEREGLVVDVRYNGGGNVSGLLLEKLARRRVGFDVQRWGVPIPYPQESLPGPMVALTNEQAGSDGDIFSHSFKLMGLGPLLGKRTWGGTIGIWPRHPLVDGTVTTQPEFAFWFPDVGWGVENYGTDPDEEVEIRPQDWRAGRDPQLARAVEVGLEEIEKANSLTEDQISSKE